MKPIAIIAIVGPTAAGKSRLAIELAERLNGEIVNVDSMLIYRYLNIGTAKPTQAMQAQVPHHLIDLIDPDGHFDAKVFQVLADQAIGEIHARKRVPILVGGTGLYLRTILKGLFEEPVVSDRGNRLTSIRADFERIRSCGKGDGLYARLAAVDPETAQRVHPNDFCRVTRALEFFYLTGQKLSAVQRNHWISPDRYRALKIGLFPDRHIIYKRIDHRVEAMVATGLLDEIRCVLQMGYGDTIKPFQTFGYRHFIMHLHNNMTIFDAISETQKDTRNFAKRQYTWFRREPDLVRITEAPRLAEIMARCRRFIA